MRSLVPDETAKGDRQVTLIRKIVMESLTFGVHGLGLRFGGLPTGQGFALGPQFSRYGLANGRLVLRVSAAGSSARAYLLDFQLTAPSLASRRLFLDFVSSLGNYPRIDYYGPGPDSRKGGRSHFRLRENRYDLIVGTRLAEHVHLGFTGGYLGMDVGTGNRKDVAHAAALYPDETSSWLGKRTDFLRGGAFLRLDYRDDPIGPRSGGMYRAQFHAYDGRGAGRPSFRQLDLEVRQYTPFFNERRVVALAGAATMSFPEDAGAVPFFLQPTLGGSDDLRGFRSYRFYDNHAVLVNAEYRWEAFSGLDIALFIDAGKVTPKRSQLNFHSLEASTGFGFRFNARNRTFLRIDTGFSHEGIQVWVKFGEPPPERIRETAISGRR
mgnify:CR=1 FL=1